MSKTSNIRQLTPKDFQLWKSIRLEMLTVAPEAFGSSFEEEVAWTNENWQEALNKNKIFGAFQEEKLIGTAGLQCHQDLKKKHIGWLFAVYVQAANRCLGVADQLVNVVINEAIKTLLQLNCGVIADNPSAAKIYERHGFVQYGVEPRALTQGDRFYDLRLMVKVL